MEYVAYAQAVRGTPATHLTPLIAQLKSETSAPTFREFTRQDINRLYDRSEIPGMSSILDIYLSIYLMCVLAL